MTGKYVSLRWFFQFFGAYFRNPNSSTIVNPTIMIMYVNTIHKTFRQVLFLDLELLYSPNHVSRILVITCAMRTRVQKKTSWIHEPAYKSTNQHTIRSRRTVGAPNGTAKRRVAASVIKTSTQTVLPMTFWRLDSQPFRLSVWLFHGNLKYVTFVYTSFRLNQRRNDKVRVVRDSSWAVSISDI